MGNLTFIGYSGKMRVEPCSGRNNGDGCRLRVWETFSVAGIVLAPNQMRELAGELIRLADLADAANQQEG